MDVTGVANISQSKLDVGGRMDVASGAFDASIRGNLNVEQSSFKIGGDFDLWSGGALSIQQDLN